MELISTNNEHDLMLHISTCNTTSNGLRCGLLTSQRLSRGTLILFVISSEVAKTHYNVRCTEKNIKELTIDNANGLREVTVIS